MKSPFLKTLFCILAIILSIGSVMAQPTAVVSTHATTCGQANGSAMVTASNGAGYTYQWSTGTSTTDTISNLAAGNYTVTVYSTLPATPDSVVSNFTIGASQPAGILQTYAPATCGQNNGTITVQVPSGTSSYQTTLIDNTTSTIVEQGNQTSFPNTLAPGIYTIIVNNNSNGCIDTFANISLIDTTSHPVFSNIAVTPVSCYDSLTGSIVVTVANCTACTFAWSQSAADHTDSAVRLRSGTYTFSVSQGACVNIDTTIIVSGPAAALYDSVGRNHADHCGQHLGSALILAAGGTAPYVYTFSEGTPLGDSVTSLTGGTNLVVYITDSHGCKDSVTVPIGNSPGPVATISSTPTCASENGGSLKVSVTGDGPFTYMWTDGQTSSADTGLAPGTYSVTVTDAGGCTITLTDSVTTFSTASSLIASPSDTIGKGQSVELQVLTGVPVTNVSWSPYISGSNGSTSVTVKPDTSTVYSVIVDYGQSCQLFDTIDIKVVSDTIKWVIPNTFTPNGDGINDEFFVISGPSVSTFHIWIYDRWGNKVFESTRMDFQWDGNAQYGGEKRLNTGVYAYVIEYFTFESGDKQIIGGNISLVK